MKLKSEHLNLDDRAINAWMALAAMLCRFGVMPQYYETSVGLRMLTKLQNRKDNDDRGV